MPSFAAQSTETVTPGDAHPGSAATGQPERAEGGGWDGWGVKALWGCMSTNPL